MEARGDSSGLWGAAIDAMTAAKRDTDIVGWLGRPPLIGVIVPATLASDLPYACAGLADRFRQEFAKRSDPETVGRFSTRFHLYPEPRRRGGHGLGLDDVRVDPDLGRPPARGTIDGAMKRGLDIAGSLTLLIILSPLLALIAGLVKLGSRGSVVFRQVRIGQMMKPFTMLKFRTMYSNADHKIHQEFVSSFIRTSGQAHRGNGLFKLTNDPRITPIGRILRTTSLDELPQLWNVLRGDMSLVGPRPPVPYEFEQYEPWHCRRVLEAKPGITGLWQVAGRSRTTFDEMVRLDIRYAKTRSLWTDIKILLATPAAVISRRGAC